jgi:LasA protease
MRMLATGVAAAALTGGVIFALPNGASAAQFPAFGLPFAPGQSTGSAGIHSDDGTSGVKNALDLNPDDGVVRAPLAGTVHIQHCDGGDWVTIDHVDGWRTGYYHMEQIRVTEGQQVEAGVELGDIGNALPCGGSSSGAHVHFTIWQLNASATGAGSRIAAGNWDDVSYSDLSSKVADAVGEPMDGKVFGGWLFNEGSEQYSGKATNQSSGEVVELPGSFEYAG